MTTQLTQGDSGRLAVIKPQILNPVDPYPTGDNIQTNYLMGSISSWNTQTYWQNHIFKNFWKS